MNTVVRGVFLFADPPVLYRMVDLAGVPGDPAEAIPLEVESSLPFGAEETAFTWAKTGKTEYLVAAAPRALLERAIERTGAGAEIRTVVPWPLALALVRAKGGKGEREVRAAGFRFRFDGARLVAAEADPSPEAPGPTPAPDEVAAAVRRAPIDFAEATGHAAAASGWSLRVAILAGLVLLASFGVEVWAMGRRAAAARSQRDESLRAVFGGGNVAQPKERLSRRARELDSRLAVLEAVLSKKDSALTLLAEITQASGASPPDPTAPTPAAPPLAPILVRDLRILEDRLAISGWASTSEQAERFRDRLAGIAGLEGIEGPEIRGAGAGYEFTIEARVVREAAPPPPSPRPRQARP